MNKLERERSTARKAGFVSSLREIGGWDRMVDDLRAGLDPFASSEPFVEPLSGLQTRELQGPDVFQRLFGPGVRSQAEPASPGTLNPRGGRAGLARPWGPQ